MYSVHTTETPEAPRARQDFSAPHRLAVRIDAVAVAEGRVLAGPLPHLEKHEERV